EENLRVRKLEPELLDRFLDRRNISLVCTVDQDVAVRGDDQERGQTLRSNVIDIADDLVWRKLSRLIVWSADVALKQSLLRERMAANRNARARILVSSSASRRRLRRSGGSDQQSGHH